MLCVGIGLGSAGGQGVSAGSECPLVQQAGEKNTPHILCPRIIDSVLSVSWERDSEDTFGREGTGHRLS